MHTTALAANSTTQSRHLTLLPTYDIILHILFHIFLLGLCVLALVALWTRAPVATFAIFLVWTIAFYALLFIFAWSGRPANSLLTVIISRLRADHVVPSRSEHVDTSSPSPILPPGQQVPFPNIANPYLHQPNHHATPYDALSVSHEGPRSMTSAEEETDEEVDDETRQRNIEDEMSRREVSIVTVPRRKLWITNPS